MFSSNSRNAMSAYRKVGVESIVDSATPQRLVLMLFDGARAAVASASAHMQSGNVAAKCKAISQAIAIVDGGLKASLDLSVGGELAQNLFELYVYMTQRLLHANLNNDASALAEVSKLMEQLGSAWESLAATPAAAAVTPAAATATPAAPRRARAVAASYGSI